MKPLMEKEIRDEIIKVLNGRHKVGTLQSEADFLTGAMQMYLLLKPKSEKDGSWCPPEWVIGIMHGKSFLE